MTSNLRANYANEIKIYGSKGVITIHEPIYRASKLTINKYGCTNNFIEKVLLKIREKYFDTLIKMPVQGNGYNYEAQEVAKCIKAGKLESDKMPLQDTLITLRIINEIRLKEEFDYEYKSECPN